MGRGAAKFTWSLPCVLAPDRTAFAVTLLSGSGEDSVDDVAGDIG